MKDIIEAVTPLLKSIEENWHGNSTLLELAAKVREAMAEVENNQLCIIWTVDDLETIAEELEDEEYDLWGRLFDREKFPELLEIIEDRHDANHGISWDSLRYALEHYGKYDD